MAVETVTAAEFKERIAQGERCEVIDVRTPVEFREVHIPFARNIPLDRIDPAQIMADRQDHADEPLYLVCRSGSRGEKACEQFLAQGFRDVVNVAGGTQAWVQAGGEVVRGKKAMSLERQVRIAAGLLVLLGIGLSYFSPWFLALSAFVGAGLVFAGVTDTCGMAMLLARMPWNRLGGGAQCIT